MTRVPWETPARRAIQTTITFTPTFHVPVILTRSLDARRSDPQRVRERRKKREAGCLPALRVSRSGVSGQTLQSASCPSAALRASSCLGDVVSIRSSRGHARRGSGRAAPSASIRLGAPPGIRADPPEVRQQASFAFLVLFPSLSFGCERQPVDGSVQSRVVLHGRLRSGNRGYPAPGCGNRIQVYIRRAWPMDYAEYEDRGRDESLFAAGWGRSLARISHFRGRSSLTAMVYSRLHSLDNDAENRCFST